MRIDIVITVSRGVYDAETQVERELTLETTPDAVPAEATGRMVSELTESAITEHLDLVDEFDRAKE